MNDLVLETHPRGTLLPVQAAPGSRRNGIDGVRAGRLRVRVTQVPEKGKANAAILDVLADVLEISKSRIELVSSPSSPQKRFLIVDLTPDEVRRRLIAK